MLKICAEGSHSEQAQSCLSIDPRKKQVTVFDPSSVGVTTSSHRRTTPVAPKMFAFDAVFSPDDSQVRDAGVRLDYLLMEERFLDFKIWSITYHLHNAVQWCFQSLQFSRISSWIGVWYILWLQAHVVDLSKLAETENCLSLAAFVNGLSLAAFVMQMF